MNTMPDSWYDPPEDNDCEHCDDRCIYCDEELAAEDAADRKYQEWKEEGW